MSKIVKKGPVIGEHEAEILSKLQRVRLRPSIRLLTVSVGGSFVHVEVSWTTHLLDGSLNVMFHVDRDVNITSQLTFDEPAMKAYATIDTKAVGIVSFHANGEFLAKLLPPQMINLDASSSCYIPS